MRHISSLSSVSSADYYYGRILVSHNCSGTINIVIILIVSFVSSPYTVAHRLISRMKSLFVALATVLAIDGATGSPSRVEFINIGLCDEMFTEDIAFDSPNGNHLQCARQCSMQDSCLTFTIAENMCRGHSVLVTPQTPSVSTPGANSFVKRSTCAYEWMLLLLLNLLIAALRR